MLDRDLAVLFDVETRVLKQLVRRNIERFPADFMFELTREDAENLTSQLDASLLGKLRHLPMVFTGSGAAMLAGVLRSPRAVLTSIEIMRAFSDIPGTMVPSKEPVYPLSDDYRADWQHARIVFDVINHLMAPATDPRQTARLTVKPRRRSNGASLKTTANGFSLTLPARKRWDSIPGDIQMKILNNVWCATCGETTGIGNVSGKIEFGALVLKGICTRCGAGVVRIVEAS